MATIYASFRVLGTEWLLHIRLLELQGVRSLKRFAKRPLCAKAFVKFCTQIVVWCPCGGLVHYFRNRYHEILSCQQIFCHVGLC